METLIPLEQHGLGMFQCPPEHQNHNSHLWSEKHLYAALETQTHLSERVKEN